MTDSTDLLGKEYAVDLLLIHEKAVLVAGLPARAPLLHPAEQQDEPKRLLISRLADVVDLLDLEALDAEILQKQREQSCGRPGQVR